MLHRLGAQPENAHTRVKPQCDSSIRPIVRKMGRQWAGIEPEGLVQPTGAQRPLAQQSHHAPAIGVGESCQKPVELRRSR
jgi:hypothetical protein